MEMLTERPSASCACFNKDVSDGSIIAGCRVRTHQLTQCSSLEACPAEAPVGRSLPSRRLAPILCTHRAGAPGLPTLVLRAIVIQEEKRWLKSSQNKGKCSKGELEEKLTKDLQNFLTPVLSLYAQVLVTLVAVFPVPPSPMSMGFLCSCRQID